MGRSMPRSTRGAAPDEIFGTRYADVNGLALQRDGKVVIAGRFTHVDGINRHGVARLNADGALDLSFNPGSGANLDYGVPSVNGVAWQWTAN